MIRKPATLARRDVAVGANLRGAAADGLVVARAGLNYARGLICWGFALLWGFAALAAGAFGDVATFVGVGALSALMAWLGARTFAKERGRRHPT